MKLFFTTTSPFARKVRVTALELGLDDQIELVAVTVRTEADEILKYSPVGMVPVLEIEDGTALSESTLICDFLFSLESTVTLLPDAGPARWEVLQLDGIAQGMLGGLATLVRELRRPQPQQSPAVLDLERVRIERCLDRMNAEVSQGSFAKDLTIAHITLGCALGVFGFRLPDYEWRDGRAPLSTWFDDISGRASMSRTEPYE